MTGKSDLTDSFHSGIKPFLTIRLIHLLFFAIPLVFCAGCQDEEPKMSNIRKIDSSNSVDKNPETDIPSLPNSQEKRIATH